MVLLAFMVTCRCISNSTVKNFSYDAASASGIIMSDDDGYSRGGPSIRENGHRTMARDRSVGSNTNDPVHKCNRPSSLFMCAEGTESLSGKTPRVEE